MVSTSTSSHTNTSISNKPRDYSSNPTSHKRCINTPAVQLLQQTHRSTSLISQQLPHRAPHNSKQIPHLQCQTQTPVPLQNSNYQDSARRIYHTPVNIQYHVSILTKLADSATHPLHHLSPLKNTSQRSVHIEIDICDK